MTFRRPIIRVRALRISDQIARRVAHAVLVHAGAWCQLGPPGRNAPINALSNIDAWLADTRPHASWNLNL